MIQSLTCYDFSRYAKLSQILMVPLPLLCKHSYSRTSFPNVNILVVITIPCNEMKWSSRLLIELLLHLLLYCFWIRRQYINLMNSNIYINYWPPCYSMSGRNNNLGMGKKHNNYCKRLETFTFLWFYVFGF